METLLWSTLAEHLARASPCLLSMGGSKGATLAYDPQAGNLALRMPIAADDHVPPSPYAELIVERRNVENRPVLEVTVMSSDLFLEFHHFADITTRALEADGQTAIGALTEAIGQWQKLVLSRPLLSDAQALGLRGELAVLAGLIRAHGPESVEAWTGTTEELPERHDFRFGSVEFEVKTTRQAKRIHIVHGLRQLEPSPKHDLYVVSLQYELAGSGSGISLPSVINSIREALGRSSRYRKMFEARLRQANYADADAAHYARRLIMAGPPLAIKVEDGVPRITSSLLDAVLSPALVSRLGDVSYSIDLEGLGIASGHKGFPEILRGVQID